MAFYDRDGSIITPERVLAQVKGSAQDCEIGLFDADDNQIAWVNHTGQAYLLTRALELDGVYWVLNCKSCGTYTVISQSDNGVCHNYWHNRPWLAPSPE